MIVIDYFLHMWTKYQHFITTVLYKYKKKLVDTILSCIKFADLYSTGDYLLATA